MPQIGPDPIGRARGPADAALSSATPYRNSGSNSGANAGRALADTSAERSATETNEGTLFRDALAGLSRAQTAQSAEQMPAPRNTRALVADIESRGMTAVILDIQNRCSEICEPRWLLDTRDDDYGNPKPMLGAVSAALTLDRYQEKYPDLTIIPAYEGEPHGATPPNLERMEAALSAGRPVFAALDFCLLHTQLVGLFPGEEQDPTRLQAFNFDSNGGLARQDTLSALLGGLATPREAVFDSQKFARQVNFTGCRAEALVFAKDFHLAQKDGPETMKDRAQTLDTLRQEGRLPQPTLRVGERRDFLRNQNYQEASPYRFNEGQPVPGKELGRHRKDHTSSTGEALFHHAKSLSYVEHALHRLHQLAQAGNTTMAELADASLERHFGPNARAHIDAQLEPPATLRRVGAFSNMASHFPTTLEVEMGNTHVENNTTTNTATGSTTSPFEEVSDNDEPWDSSENPGWF